MAALKDPIGGNLDRIQVVKGWLDAKGGLHEKVFDVAWSGDRKPDPIEIPTPRWTAYDVSRFGVKPLPGTRRTVTERAYTSPIWYTPN